MNLLKCVLALLSLLPLSAQAQFGITGSYRWNEAGDWKAIRFNREEPIVGNYYAVGLDYWFRLKNYRVEFLPEVNVSFYKNDFPVAENITHRINFQTYNFFGNINFYPFDFFGDCDCPTWSKQGKFFQKGFFLQVSPGVSYFQQEVARPDQRFSSNALVVSLGAGAGFDIGLTDLVTLSPLVAVRYYAPNTWNSLPELSSKPVIVVKDTRSAMLQLHAGARLGFRFDYTSRRR